MRALQDGGAFFGMVSTDFIRGYYHLVPPGRPLHGADARGRLARVYCLPFPDPQVRGTGGTRFPRILSVAIIIRALRGRARAVPGDISKTWGTRQILKRHGIDFDP